MEEQGQLVDEADRVIGSAPRSEIRARGLLHRGVAIMCRDPAGAIYVHRRTTTKDVFPGLYDMWAGGMVAAGEDYEDAARREVAEELGVTGVPLTRLFAHHYTGADCPTWTTTFEVTWAAPVVPQAEEIAWGAFLPLDELLARLDEWPFVPDGLELFRRWLSVATT
jgi:8-oxo-dGTP pyrophosphatase MutT (NUDIX family)